MQTTPISWVSYGIHSLVQSGGPIGRNELRQASNVVGSVGLTDLPAHSKVDSFDTRQTLTG